jgi:hypothetical protein
MWMGHDGAWWGLVLAVVALVLMLPANLLANFLTPLIQNWIATWGKTSLENRITKLEGELAELEKHPVIDEVQDQLLWGITSLKIAILSAAGGVIVVILLGVETLANKQTTEFKLFNAVTALILTANLLNSLILRYSKGFRHKRSPKVRAGLREAIDELKEIHSNWGPG